MTSIAPLTPDKCRASIEAARVALIAVHVDRAEQLASQIRQPIVLIVGAASVDELIERAQRDPIRADAVIVVEAQGWRPAAAWQRDRDFRDLDVTKEQRRAIRAAIENFAASDEAELFGVKVIDPAEFLDEGAEAKGTYVELRYRRPGDDSGIPGREVHVYAADGKVLDCQDFG